MTTAMQRSAARRGTARGKLRRELRELDSAALLKRLARYTGRTVGEERRRWQPPFATDRYAINRDAVIDLIVHCEVPE